MAISSSHTLRADRVIVGGGAMGLAAAAELTRRGLSVVVLEQYDLHHPLGASHGATRNFNNAYAETDYLDLFDESRDLWHELERETGRSLLGLHGLITHGDPEAIAASHAALVARGAAVELISPEEAASRWTGMRFEGDTLVGQDAGVVKSAEALCALEEVAKRGGALIRTQNQVREIDTSSGPGVTVVADTPQGETVTVIAAGAVVAGGAWTTPLLAGIIELPKLTVTEEHPAHFAVRDTAAVWPSFNHIARSDWVQARGGNIYGMPTPGEGVKVGFHAVGETVDPDHRTFAATAEKRRELRDYVAEWFPGLDPDSGVEISCTYTSTDSGDFLLDRVGPLTIAAGFSGHGFKFVPGIGRLLADASTEVALPPERFRLAAHGVERSRA
ncbi:FAD-dependent oxidoreductase [Leucobacter sp. W1478]|uniref:FAD-dependent oxidoreductase n=1 Tax=Leucobacter sp. W1478 TaxID=3439065 RepID=UPI003F392D18